MAIQTFVADTILTAAQMNALQGNDYNQTVSTKTASYVLVAADKGTKVVMNSASATTITVNTSLFSAGDTLTILNIGAGVCTITAGTATVSTTGSLALAQNGGGTLYFTSAGVSVFQADGVAASASGLTLVTAQTIGSGVASVTVSNAFSSTYENYLIFISGGVGNGNTTMALTLGSTVTGYYSTLIYMNYNANTVNGQGQSNGASWPSSYSSVDNLNGAMTLFGPNLAKNTVMHCEAAGTFTTGETTLRRGYLANTTQYTAFTITTSGTLTGGTVRVYGYQNS